MTKAKVKFGDTVYKMLHIYLSEMVAKRQRDHEIEFIKKYKTHGEIKTKIIKSTRVYGRNKKQPVWELWLDYESYKDAYQR
jgi:hypothetical protein